MNEIMPFATTWMDLELVFVLYKIQILGIVPAPFVGKAILFYPEFPYCIYPQKLSVCIFLFLDSVTFH